MNKEEMRFRLQHLASLKSQYTADDKEEFQMIMDQWNSLVPVAEKLGVTHAEMNEIWYAYPLKHRH